MQHKTLHRRARGVVDQPNTVSVDFWALGCRSGHAISVLHHGKSHQPTMKPMNTTTAVFEATALAFLPEFASEHANVVGSLNRLPKSDGCAIAWRSFVTSPRAVVFEQRAVVQSNAFAMVAMICVPREMALVCESTLQRPNWLDSFDTFGVSRRTRQICVLNGRAQTPAEDALGIQAAALMGNPALAPSWNLCPSLGISSNWTTLATKTGANNSTLAQRIAAQASDCHQRLERTILRSPVDAQCSREESWRFLNSLAELEARIARVAVSRFCAYLDSRALAQCLKHRLMVCPEEYNWIVGGKTMRQRSRRMDALRLFPALAVASPLAQHASNISSADPPHGSHECGANVARVADESVLATLGGTVDSGAPLIKAQAQALCVRPVVIKALRGVSCRTASVFFDPPLGWPHLLRTLNGLPPERLPKAAVQWQGFARLYRACVDIHAALLGLNADSAAVFFEGTANDWLIRSSKNWTRSARLWQVGMYGLKDLTSAVAIARQLQDWTVAEGLNGTRRDLAYERLSRIDPPKWQGLARTIAGKKDLSLETWSKVFPTREVHGLMVRELNSNWDLFQEGAAMNHCIHTYRERFRNESLLAFSIGEGSRIDRSTALYSCRVATPGKWAIRLEEHRARFNHVPSAAARQFAVWLGKEIEGPEYFEALKQARDNLRIRYNNRLDQASGIRWLRFDRPGGEDPVAEATRRRSMLLSSLEDLIQLRELKLVEHT